MTMAYSWEASEHAMKLRLHHSQTRIRFHWTSLFLVESTTIVPVYSEYKRTWDNSDYINPFNVDWLLYENGDDLAIDYLMVVYKALSEQLMMFTVDSDTRKSSIFYMFREFVQLIEEMLIHDISMYMLPLWKHVEDDDISFFSDVVEPI